MIKTKNTLSDADREYVFGILTHEDVRMITNTKARLTGRALGETMKKYVPLAVKAGLSFKPTTTEHSLGKLCDNLSQVRGYGPTNKNPKGDARAKLKSIHAALAVQAIDKSWALQNLVACGFDAKKTAEVLKTKYKSSEAFISALEAADAHPMYMYGVTVVDDIDEFLKSIGS